MGQQQLLLIVLGVVVIGIAIVVGLSIATSSAQNANRDGIISDMNTMANFAHKHYRTPTRMGGGGNTFTGWTIPFGIDTTDNGTFSATVVAQTVTLIGIGNEIGNDGSSKVKATAIVTSAGIIVTINN